MVSGVWRKFFLILSAFIGLLFLIKHNNLLNNELENYKNKFKLSIENIESLSTQLKILNDHKEMINKMLEEERLRFEKELKKLTDAFNDINSQNNKIHALLEECKLQTFKESQVKQIKPPFQIESLNKFNEIFKNISNNLTTQTLATIKTEVINFDKNKTESDNEINKNQSQNLTIFLNKNKENNVSSIHNYVNGNSVHFHRQESANKNLEFQRANNVEFDKKNELKTIEDEAKVISRPKINILNNFLKKTKISEKSFLKKKQNNNNTYKDISKHLLKKERQRLDGGENHENEENVVDFRKDDIPDLKNNEDYKEMNGKCNK